MNCSSCCTRVVTTELATPSWRAASAKLPVSATRTNASMLRNRSIVRRYAAYDSGQRAPDQDALDIAGAFVDLANAHVAPDALDREIGYVAIPSEHLDRVRTDLFCHLGREQLGHRGFLQAGQSCIAQARRVMRQLARGFDLGRHV